MRKIFIKSILFFSLVLAVAFVLDFFWTGYFQKKENMDTEKKENWILAKSGEEYTYAVLGSSRALNMFDVNLLKQECKCNAINIANSGSSFGDQYVLLKKFLQKNKVANLLLQVDEYSYDSKNAYSYPFKHHYFMPWFFEKDIREVYRDYSNKFYFILWHIPFFRYIEFNEFYKLINLKRNKENEYNKTEGYEPLYGQKEAFDCKKKSYHGFTSLDEKYFNKIISLCKDNDVNILFYSAPVQPLKRRAEINADELYAYIRNTADKNNIPYIDFSELKMLDISADFNDCTHLTFSGTQKLTACIAQELSCIRNN